MILNTNINTLKGRSRGREGQDERENLMSFTAAQNCLSSWSLVAAASFGDI